jgi:hypothetical protein
MMNDHTTESSDHISDFPRADAARRTAPSFGSRSKRDLDRMLDEALEDTFPASDPVSIVLSARSG